MRRALKTDVKVRNARKQSKYYETHGGAPLTLSSGGSRKRQRGEEDDDDEVYDDEDAGRGSRRRRTAAGSHEGTSTRERRLAELDAELDRFTAGEPDPSTSESATPLPLSERIGRSVHEERRIAPLPGQRRGARGGGGGGSGKSNPRPSVDKDTLDAELDAFLHQKE